MQMLEGNSNILQEFQLSIFVEEWVEVVVSQIAKMCQYYEDDTTIGLICGEDLTNNDLQSEITVRADVGASATNPQAKINNLMFGLSMLNQLFEGYTSRLDPLPVSREVFGAIGYNDGEKFLLEQDENINPEIEQLKQVIAQMQQAIQTDQAKISAKAQADAMLEQIKAKNSINELLLKLQSDRQIKFTEMAINRGVKVKDIESKAGANQEKLQLDLLKEANRRADIETKAKELNYKMSTGNEGI
jgi:hypothetical protein